MPHSKKPKLTHADAANMASSNASLNDLSADELAMIFGCLGPVNIMPLRRVCHKWGDAAKKTIVPLTKFRVHDEKSYNAMRAMATALPNLQHLEL
eukprot:scaffold15202_cov135-Skeletonema_dohrnii-CCMP3373.AAC.1